MIQYNGVWTYMGPSQIEASVPTHQRPQQAGLFGNDEQLSSDPNARGVRIEVSSDLTLLLQFDHLLFSELRQIDEGQRLCAHFVSHEVTLTGTGLRRI